MMLEDKQGYLWITTLKGVVRYNGYEFKTYDLSNGLADNEVWGMYMDSKERIWLYNFSNTVGYIYRGKYQSIPFDNGGYVMYPKYFTECRDGVLFTSNYKDELYLYQEKKNHLFPILRLSGPIIPKEHCELIEYTDTSFTVYSFNAGKINKLRSFRFAPFFSATVSKRASLTSFKNYLIAFLRGYSLMFADIENGQQQYFSPDKYHQDNISYVYAQDDYLFLIYGKKIYKLDTNLKVNHIYSIPKLLGRMEPTRKYFVSYFHNTSFWGTSIATESHGMYFSFETGKHFQKIPSLSLMQYKFVNSVNKEGYWWNTYTRTLAIVNEDNEISYRSLNVAKDPTRIIPYNNKSSILFADKFYWFDKKKTIRDFFYDFNYLPQIKYSYKGINGIVYDKNIFYMLVTGRMEKYSLHKDSVHTVIDQDRFNDMVYDSVRNMIWAYHSEKILLHQYPDKTFIINKNLLQSFGINKIEQILIDNMFGNVLLKDHDKLLTFDIANKKAGQLFLPCNLSNAKVYQSKNTVVVTGKFGVAFIRIKGVNSYSEPLIYYNIKEYYYNVLYDVQVSDEKILLSTDRGVYQVLIPEDKDFRQQNAAPLTYRLLISNNNDTYDVSKGDTIVLNQQDLAMQFDIIRPTGSGKIKYSYSFQDKDIVWKEMNINELNMPVTTLPGVYIKMFVRVRDDVWQSKAIPLYVYIIPYWWQTVAGKTLISLSILLLLFISIYITFFITRKITAQRIAQKNRLLELEIKSIHSQINPHFIFNTLNTTLHFIKKEKPGEAYNHLTKFSHLLRAYLKSSRNRYIHLSEEIANLRNYIELQQSRFTDNKFTYNISVQIPETDVVRIPSLLLQPLVENAINHGLLPKAEGKAHLQIEFSKNDNVLYCKIDDNGIGRRQSKLSKEDRITQRESYGEYLMKDLVDVLNKYEKKEIEIQYFDKEMPFTGTIVTVIIKQPDHG